MGTKNSRKRDLDGAIKHASDLEQWAKCEKRKLGGRKVKVSAKLVGRDK